MRAGMESLMMALRPKLARRKATPMKVRVQALSEGPWGKRRTKVWEMETARPMTVLRQATVMVRPRRKRPRLPR